MDIEIMEIILLIAGGLIFILSFFIPEGKSVPDKHGTLSEDEINKLLAQELAVMRSRIDEMAREAVEDVMYRTERALEKLTNEKIMAVSEYSDTVLSEIHKNHEEAVFLYDMLNNKHTSLKNALSEINRAIKDVEEAKRVLEKQVRQETEEPAPESKMPEEAELADEFLSDEGINADGSQNSSNAQILELYSGGKSIIEIAKELNRGIGEVKLVVELYKGQTG